MKEVSVIFQDAFGITTTLQVGYWSGSSAASIIKSATAALNLSEGSTLVLTNEDSGQPLFSGSSDTIPQTLLGTLRERSASNRVASFGSDRDLSENPITNDLPDDQAFQEQYVKFERVLSHLANERTWLAWIRVSLTLLTTAFVIWQLYSMISDHKHSHLKKALHWLGIGYALVVPLTTLCGWVRYERTKAILGLSDSALHNYFGSLGVAVQAALLCVIFSLTVGVYGSLGEYYVFNR